MPVKVPVPPELNGVDAVEVDAAQVDATVQDLRGGRSDAEGECEQGGDAEQDQHENALQGQAHGMTNGTDNAFMLPVSVPTTVGIVRSCSSIVCAVSYRCTFVGILGRMDESEKLIPESELTPPAGQAG